MAQVIASHHDQNTTLYIMGKAWRSLAQEGGEISTLGYIAGYMYITIKP